MKLSNLFFVLAMGTLGSRAIAHEFWIEPDTHFPKSESVLSARLMMGHANDKEFYARNPRHLAEFALWNAEARVDLSGRPGEDPAGRVRLSEEGALWLSYRSNASKLEMTPKKFESYLLEEGLESVVAERKALGESGRPGYEAYTRYAKALILTEGAPTTGFDRVLGLDLELVPLSDPFAYETGKPNEKLGFRLISKGKALAGAKVHAQSLDHLTLQEVAARTDERGLVHFNFPKGGRWVISAVHMERAPRAAKHDWSSAWASLTLPLPQAPAVDEEASASQAGRGSKASGSTSGGSPLGGRAAGR